MKDTFFHPVLGSQRRDAVSDLAAQELAAMQRIPAEHTWKNGFAEGYKLGYREGLENGSGIWIEDLNTISVPEVER